MVHQVQHVMTSAAGRLGSTPIGGPGNGMLQSTQNPCQVNRTGLVTKHLNTPNELLVYIYLGY